MRLPRFFIKQSIVLNIGIFKNNIKIFKFKKDIDSLEANNAVSPGGYIQCSNTIEEIDSYPIVEDVVNARIIMNNNDLVYCVEELVEPLCRNTVKQLAQLVVQQHIVNGFDQLTNSLVERIVDEYLAKTMERKTRAKNNNSDKEGCEGYSREEIIKIVTYYASSHLYSYRELYPLILDPNIEEIAVDPPHYNVKVVARQTGPIWLMSNIVLTPVEAERIIVSLARRSGRDLSLAHPYVEGLLPEGHRIAATLGREVTRFGSSMVIRKHRNEPLGIPELIKQGVLPVTLAAYLWLLVELRSSAIIVGPTASGKTTLLQAMLDFVPPWARIVSVEDTPELNLSHHPHWDSLVTRLSLSSDGEDIDLYKLARFALRRRPDYLVIGEIRGEEARVLAYAASSGHAAYTTFHADNAWMALQRLTNKPFNIPKVLLSSIDVLIVVARTGCGRRVVEVAETSYDAGSDVVSLLPLYAAGDGCELRGLGDLSLEDLLDNSSILKKINVDRTILKNVINDKINILNISNDRSNLIKRIRTYYMENLGVAPYVEAHAKHSSEVV